MTPLRLLGDTLHLLLGGTKGTGDYNVVPQSPKFKRILRLNRVKDT